MYHQYVVKTQFFNFLARKFRIYDPSDNLAFYCEMKAFKLKEDIRVYADEAKTRELLTIKARKILDLAATYDVTDATTGQKVGALKRKGLKSMLRDEWSVLDAGDREFAIIQEDSMLMALIRRYFIKIIPQSFSVMVGGTDLIDFKQNFNPFLLKLSLDFSRDPNFTFDRRLGIAAAILITAIEGRQG
jgi:uncharacterized protein YxjI